MWYEVYEAKGFIFNKVGMIYVLNMQEMAQQHPYELCEEVLEACQIHNEFLY